MSLFCNATFVTSVAHARDLPAWNAPEVAFAGRSNAGKSSAINALAGHKRLAFVSRTPGRTQLINFFRLADGGVLADLPGYGYAQVPVAIRQGWRGLIESYLTRRENLAGLVVIMDARRPLTELDRQLIDWFATTGKPMHALLTKADKLSRGAAQLALATASEQARRWPQLTLQLFSSLKRQGLEEAEQRIGEWLEAAGKNKAPG